MSNKHRNLLVISIFVIATVVLSACTQSLSSAPAATPTLIPTGLFVSPIANSDNPMAMIEEFAAQTAAAQTATAGGGNGTPATAENVASGTGTAVPQTGTVEPPSPTVIVDFSTPTNANNTQQPAAATSVPSGSRPSTYTLQAGEFPYCIARRYNVDPDQLLSLSGLTNAQSFSLTAGTVLAIPQSGAFPGDRSLAAHPTTYTVGSSNETVYSVACKFGDVDPNQIASANGISVSAPLTGGQSLSIP